MFRYHLNLAMIGVPQPLQKGFSASLQTSMQQMAEQAFTNMPTSSRHGMPTVLSGTRSPLMILDGQMDTNMSRMTPATSTIALQSPVQAPVTMIPPNILKAMFQTPTTCQAMFSGTNLRYDILNIYILNIIFMTAWPVCLFVAELGVLLILVFFYENGQEVWSF